MNYFLRQSVETMMLEAFNPYTKHTNLPSSSCMTELFKSYPDHFSDIDEMNCVKYFKEIVIPHKLHVFNEGLKLMEFPFFDRYGINPDDFLKRLMHHDLSKFSYTEAVGYMHKHFKQIDFGSSEFKLAWNHHKNHNDHHAEYWMSVNSMGVVEYLQISNIAIMEMFADWMGAGHSYGESFEDWFPKHSKRFKFHPLTATTICNITQFMFHNDHVSINDYPIEGCSIVEFS